MPGAPAAGRWQPSATAGHCGCRWRWASGIGVYFALPFEPSAAIALTLGAAGVLVACAAVLSPELAIKACLALAAALLVGFGVAKLRTEMVAAPVLFHRIGPVAMEGRVEFAQIHGKGVRAVFALQHVARDYGHAMPAHVRVSFRNDGGLLVPGAHVAFKAVLLPPPAPAAPGDYDFGRAAYFERLGAVGYAYGEPRLLASAAPPDFAGRIAAHIAHLRWRMSQRIHAVLPGSTGAIASAIITGDRGGISDDDESALRDAGLAHVLAIAGLHMALVGMGLFWAVRAVLAAIPRLALVYPVKKWAAVAALGGAGFYLVISGAAAATTRAFIMLAMMLIAILFDRPALSMRSLAFAACIILILRPESLVEPGFQMSFAAVTGLIAVAEWEQRRAGRRGASMRFATLRRYLHGIAITSFVGSLATMPYAAFHFDRATHYAVLGNLGAMPIMGFVAMPAAAIAVIAMPFGLDAWPLHFMGWGIDAMLAVGRFVSHLPGAVSIVSAWPVPALVLVSAGGLWIAFWRARWRWLGLVAVAAGLMIAFFVRPPDLFVARDGETIALRGSDGWLHLLRPAADTYSADEWLKRDGDARVAEAAIATPADGMRCDEWGCIAHARDGEMIAAVLRADALAEDCARADIVLSAVPTRHACIGPKLVIDRFDVARNGAYALWFGKTLVVQTAEAQRGVRPWSVRPPRQSSQAPSE